LTLLPIDEQGFFVVGNSLVPPNFWRQPGVRYRKIAQEGRKMSTVILLMGHGSRDQAGTGEFVDLVGAVRECLPAYPVEASFLEFPGPAVPSIQEGFDRCAARGASKVLAVPVLLLEAGHARSDMPAQVDQARIRHSGIDIRCARHLGIHPLMIDILEERIAQTDSMLEPMPPEETAVLLVGRGTSDPEANGDFYKIGRLLWERNLYGLVECSFISLANPNVSEGINRCIKLGARRVLVMPYFINTGILVKRISEEVSKAENLHPEIKIAVGGHLGVHPNVIKLLVSRTMALLDESKPVEAISWGRSWRAPIFTHQHANDPFHFHL
jgi:sirohydrochlorin cobaltochelatase